jgi:hypothetical protein
MPVVETKLVSGIGVGKRRVANGARFACGLMLSLGMATSVTEQSRLSDDGGRVVALETAWNHAIETKDAKAIEMFLADSVESDGTIATRGEYLAESRRQIFSPGKR